LKKIRSDIKSAWKNTVRFGIRNVADRLERCTHGHCRISLGNVSGEGTHVTIRPPLLYNANKSQ